MLNNPSYCKDCGEHIEFCRCGKDPKNIMNHPTTVTETVSEKKIWGSTCCNVGVMCRGIGKEHHHICNRCNKKCEVKYENNR